MACRRRGGGCCWWSLSTTLTLISAYTQSPHPDMQNRRHAVWKKTTTAAVMKRSPLMCCWATCHLLKMDFWEVDTSQCVITLQSGKQTSCFHLKSSDWFKERSGAVINAFRGPEFESQPFGPFLGEVLCRFPPTVQRHLWVWWKRFQHPGISDM